MGEGKPASLKFPYLQSVISHYHRPVMNVGASGVGGRVGGLAGSGGGRLLKEQGNFDFDNQERCKSPPKSRAGTHIATAHGGW